MRNRFRIEYHRSGINYAPAYASTIKGAVKVARKKGWWSAFAPPHDLSPISATISERTGELWEKVATVSANGINVEDNRSRGSHKRAEQQVAKAQAVIVSTYSVMVALNCIADKEDKSCR